MARRRYALSPKPRRIALAAVLLGVALHLAVFSSLRVEVGEPTPPRRPDPFIVLAHLGPEEIAVLDPARGILDSPGEPGDEVLPRYDLPVLEAFGRYQPDPDLVPDPAGQTLLPRTPPSRFLPIARLLEQDTNPFDRMGSDPSRTSGGGEPAPRLQVRVRRLVGEGSDLAVSLPAEQADPSFLGGPGNPARFLVESRPGQGWTSPLMTVSTGIAAADRSLRALITEGLIPLPTDPGYFEIIIYPGYD